MGGSVKARAARETLCSSYANDTTLVAALLDRLLHHSHIVQISGESYRLKGKSAAGIVPTNIASRAMLVNNEIV